MLKQIGTTIPAVFAAFLVALAVTVLQSGSVRAADCIAGPNSHAPQGSHWYYRIDRVKQRKCWYFRPRGQKVRNAEPQVHPAERLLAPVGAKTARDGLITPTQVEQPSPETSHATTNSVRAQRFEQQQGAAMSAPAAQDNKLQGRALTETHVIDAHDAAQVRQSVAATTEMSDSTTVPLRGMLLLFASSLVIAGIFHRIARTTRREAGDRA